MGAVMAGIKGGKPGERSVLCYRRAVAEVFKDE